jgi:aminoglycoside phosphotransferase (APT) family kinase protein
MMDTRTISDALQAFVERSVGEPVLALDYHRDSIGFSRMIWFARTRRQGGEEKDYVIRHDDGNGPFSLIPSKTLKQEGALIAALHARGLPVPRIHGVDDAGRAIVMEKLAGSADFTQVTPESRSLLIDTFAAALATLHALPVELAYPDAPSQDDLPGDLPDYLATYRTYCDASPVLDRAVDWLTANKPLAPARDVIVHGDAGSGNFMFEGDRFFGLIDWEMAHRGDPMEDFAAIYFRTYIRGGGGDLLDWYRPVIAATGWTYDPGKIEYFRFGQFWKAAVLTELFKSRRPDIDPAILAAPMKRTEAALRATEGDASGLHAMGFPDIPAVV